MLTWIKQNKLETPNFIGTPSTDLQIYETMVQGGFTAAIAIVMTAIALRESGGIATAWNNNTATGDNSYGWLQIDMLNSNVASIVNKNILKGGPNSLLFTPLINAQTGAMLWAHHNDNLNLLWYINRTTTDYYTRYASFLPRAVAAAVTSSLSEK